MPPVREPRHHESVSKPWRERPHLRARSVARGAPPRVVHATSCQSVSRSVARRIRGRNAPPSTTITSADRARIRRRSAASCSGRVRVRGAVPARDRAGHHAGSMARCSAPSRPRRCAPPPTWSALRVLTAPAPRAGRPLRDGHEDYCPPENRCTLRAPVPLTRRVRVGNLRRTSPVPQGTSSASQHAEHVGDRRYGTTIARASQLNITATDASRAAVLLVSRERIHQIRTT